MLRQISALAGWTSLDHAVRLAVGLIVTVLLARTLGPEAFGTYSLVIATAGIVAFVVPIASDAVATRDLVARPDEMGLILGTQLLTRFLGSAVAFFVILFGAAALGDQKNWPLYLIAGLAFFLQPFEVFAIWLRVFNRGGVFFLVRLPSLVVAAALRLLLALSAVALWSLVGIYSLESALAALGLVCGFQLCGGSISSLNTSLAEFIKCLKSSWPLYLSGILSILYLRIDAPMIGWISSAEEVGIYSAAMRLSEAWYLVPTIVVAATQPSLVSIALRSDDDFRTAMRSIYAAVTWGTVLIAATMSYFAHDLIGFLFGVQYAGAASVLAIHIWSAVPLFLTIVSGQIFLIKNQNSIQLYRSAAGLVLNVVLNFLLIPEFGALGAAVASLVAYSAAMLAMAFTALGRLELISIIEALDPRSISGFPAEMFRRISAVRNRRSVGY